MMGKKIKVAFFSGPTDSSVCLADVLCEYCDIDFFFAIRSAEKRDSSILNLLNPKVNKIPINSYRIRDIRNLWSYYKVVKKLNNYQIIHVQEGNIWFSLWRHFFKKVPIVCTIHDPYQHIGLKISNRYYEDITQRWIVSQSSKFIIFGKRLKQLLTKRYNIPLESIEVIPHGEYSFYKRFKPKVRILNNKKRRFIRILFFGTIRKNKGLEYLIKAEPIISEKFSDYKICIAGKFQGDVDYYKGLIQNRDKFEIIDKYVPNNQVADIFETSDIVVLPYISATQSGVLHLAFGFGKPIVASDVGSISEVLEDGKTGLLIPPCNEKLLARAILELLLDKEKCLRFGKNVKEVAKNKLNWKNIGRQTLQLYKSVIE